MVKAIIFDFWGTLVGNGIYSPVKQVQRILELQMPFSEYIVQFEHVFMTEQFLNLKEAFEAVCNHFNVSPDPQRIEALIGMWNKNRLLANIYPESQEVLEHLHGKVKLILVSNTDPFSVEPALEKFQLARFFDGIYLSYKERHLKSDPALFEKILADHSLAKEDVLMVGDSIESDMRAAEQAGVPALLIDRKDRREYPEKIADLRELLKVVA